MNENIKYWKWKSTIIDFNAISDEPIDYASYPKKKEWVFRYLGIPDNDIHEWYNGGFSSEYNHALKYAKELGLVEDYIDYDDIIYDLKQQLEQRDNIISASINKYIKEYEQKIDFEIDMGSQGEYKKIKYYEEFINKLNDLKNILEKE